MNLFWDAPLSVEHLKIPMRGLPTALDGLTLVQLSDFHYDGLRLSHGVLQEAIAATNAANPDLIVLTGDYITHDPHPIYELVTQLKTLRSRVGIYAILGNHDLYQRNSRQIVTQAITAAGIPVLWDEVVYPCGSALALVGLREYWAPPFNPGPVMERIPENTPRIVLSHNPDTAEILRPWRVDLQLSGHTHGGQITIPGHGPILAGIVKLTQQNPVARYCLQPLTRNLGKVVQHWEWMEGFHWVGQNRLYVNRGLGTYWPGRLFCPPEVTIIKLQSW